MKPLATIGIAIIVLQVSVIIGLSSELRKTRAEFEEGFELGRNNPRSFQSEFSTLGEHAAFGWDDGNKCYAIWLRPNGTNQNWMTWYRVK